MHDEVARLRSQVAALEQLLQVHESAVLEQAERLEGALAENRARADEADRLRASAERNFARMELLAEAGSRLAQSLDYETTLRSVADLAVPGIADWCIIDLMDPDGSVARVAVAHSDPGMVRLVEDLRERYPDDPDARYGVPHVLRTGVPELVERIPASLLEESARDAEHLRIIQSLGLESYAIVPLQARDRTLGALTLVSTNPERLYGAEDLRLAQELAVRAALAIDNARLVRDLESTQQHLEQTAVEVEAQAEELQSTVEELEVTTQELLDTNAELQAAKEEADQARHAAEDANAAKSQFLATMSHELRTPLNAIDGYAELMQLGIHGALTDQQDAALVRIRSAQKRLLSLINDVLNFAKLESGQIEFHFEEMPVSVLVTDVETLMLPQVTARQLSLVIDTATDAVVNVDRERAEQILLNLLANAVKFTEPGGTIRLTTAVRGASVEVSVEDTGVGIQQDRIEAIFEPFVQAESGMVREHGGVGLGLAISRDLARSMHGDLRCTSALGAGSTFTFSLPAVSTLIRTLVNEELAGAPGSQ